MSTAPAYLGSSGLIPLVGPIPDSEPYNNTANVPTLADSQRHVATFDPGYAVTLLSYGMTFGAPTPGIAWYTWDITDSNPGLTGLYGNFDVHHPTAADADSTVTINNLTQIDGTRAMITGTVDGNGAFGTPLQYFAQIITCGSDGSIAAGAPVFLTEFGATGPSGGNYDAGGVFGDVLAGEELDTPAGFPDLVGPLYPDVSGMVPVVVAVDTVVIGLGAYHYINDVGGTIYSKLYVRRLDLSGSTITPGATWSTAASLLGSTATIVVFGAAKMTNLKATFIARTGPTNELRYLTVDATSMVSSTFNVITGFPGVVPDRWDAVQVSDGKIGVVGIETAGSTTSTWMISETATLSSSTITGGAYWGPSTTSHTLRTPNGGILVAGNDGGSALIGEVRWDATNVASLVGPTTVDFILFDGEALTSIWGTKAFTLSFYNAFGTDFIPDSAVSATLFLLEAVPTISGGGGGGVIVVPADSGGQGAFAKLLSDFTIAHVNGTEDIQSADVALAFNAVDDDGTLWIVSQVVGWWTTPEPDSIDTERGWSDGSYYDTGRYKARVFTVTGTFIPKVSNGHYVQKARDRLLRAVNTVRRTGVAFIAKEADVTAPAPIGSDDYTTIAKYSYVLPSGAPLIDTVSMTGRNDWAITFRAPDPTKYSVTPAPVAVFESNPMFYSVFVTTYALYSDVTATGFTYSALEGNVNAIDVTNIGNYRTPCMIRVTGPIAATPLTIVNNTTGQTITITHTVGAGEVLLIDTNARRVSLDGVYDYRYYLAPDVDWIYVAPGINNITADTNTNPDATIELQFRHGWIG